MKIYNYNDFGFENFFKELEKRKLIIIDQFSESQLKKISIKEMIELSSMFNELSLKSCPEVSDTLGVLIASDSISGENYPCNSLKCRLQKVEQLKYSALVLGKITFFKNPLQHFTELSNNYSDKEDIKILRDYFFSEISILLSLRELLKYGLVIPYQVETEICFDCLLREAGGTPISHEDVTKKLKKLYFQNTHITLDLDSEGLHVNLQGPEYMYDHGAIAYTRPDVPEYFLKNKNFQQAVNRSISYALKKNEFNKIEAIDNEIHYIMSQAISQLIYKHRFKCDLIIDRTIEHEVIRMFYDKNDLARDQLNLNQIYELLPFIPQIPIQKLVELRIDEQLAFESHIANLSKLKKELLSNPNELSTAYKDLILPELHKLQAKIDKATRDTKSNNLSNIFLVGGITFCFVSGIFKNPFEALGGTIAFEAMRSLKGKILESSNPYENEDYYYLLKMKSLTRK